MSLDTKRDRDRPEKEAGCTDECAHTRLPSPKEVLLGRAEMLRQEAAGLELLAHALPGIMPEPAVEAFLGILEVAL